MITSLSLGYDFALANIFRQSILTLDAITRPALKRRAPWPQRRVQFTDVLPSLELPQPRLVPSRLYDR